MPLHPGDDTGQSCPILQICKNKWTGATHAAGVTIHHLERRAHMRGKIDLIDDQQVGARDAGSTLARNLVAARHVDHVDGHIDQFRAEHGRQVIAAAFHEDQLEVGQFGFEIRDGLQVHRSVLADRRMRAPAGFDAANTLRRQRPLADQELRIFFRINIVCDDADAIAAGKFTAQAIDERSLAASHRTRHANPKSSHATLD